MISVFVATSGRPDMFDNMLRSLRQTTQKHDIEIVAAIDHDPIAWDIAVGYGCRVWYKVSKRGALQAWNDSFSMAMGDILVPAGDDQIFHDGWLDYALESHRERLGGYGMLGMNDLAYDGNTQLATMWLFDRKYCEDVMGGVFAPPVYKYYCVDSEWNAKAKIWGKFYWEERSKVEHLHSAHGKRPVDDLDREKMEAGWMERDNEVFRNRKARGFPIEWTPII